MKLIMKKLCCILLMGSCMLLFLSFNSGAYYYHQMNIDGLYQNRFSPRLTSGVDGIHSYLGLSLYPSYENDAQRGVLSWNYEYQDDNNIYDINITCTDTHYTSSVIDIKAYDSNTSSFSAYFSYNGFTRVWCGDGISGNNNTSYDSSSDIPEDYFAAECFINASAISASDGNHVRSTFAHEVGHALGLGDVPGSTGTIMNPSYPDRTVHTPSENDQIGVVYLYIFRTAN